VCVCLLQGGAGSLSQAGPSRPQMLAPSRERTMPNTTQEDDSAEEDANDDEEEKQDQEEYSSAEYSDAEYAGAQLGGAAAAAARAPMSALDEAFERLAMDYEDDDIGGLDEYEEDVHGANDVKLYERVFDKFLDEKALDGELENGQYIAVGKATEGWNRKQEQETAEAALAKTHELGRKMQKDEAEGRRYEENLLTDHAVRDLTELWDCETIVSTYSNLDNHPGVINDEPARKQKARAAATAAAAASGPAGQIKLSR
jgi:protein LTV1